MNSAKHIVVYLLLTSMASCVDIEGGSVEFRWDLQYGGQDCQVAGEDEPRCKSGTRISCDLAKVGYISLVSTPLHGATNPCQAEPKRCRFSCNRKVGTTAFFIPDGDYALSLRALDSEFKELGPADGVAAPAPVVRQITTGQLTDLDVNLIIVKRCSGC